MNNHMLKVCFGTIIVALMASMMSCYSDKSMKELMAASEDPDNSISKQVKMRRLLEFLAYALDRIQDDDTVDSSELRRVLLSSDDSGSSESKLRSPYVNRVLSDGNYVKRNRKQIYSSGLQGVWAVPGK